MKWSFSDVKCGRIHATLMRTKITALTLLSATVDSNQRQDKYPGTWKNRVEGAGLQWRLQTASWSSDPAYWQLFLPIVLFKITHCATLKNPPTGRKRVGTCSRYRRLSHMREGEVDRRTLVWIALLTFQLPLPWGKSHVSLIGTTRVPR